MKLFNSIITLLILFLKLEIVKSRARSSDDMFITCKVGCIPKRNTKSGRNLICVRESFQGTSCQTQKKYGCGFGEHILKEYSGEVVSAAFTQGCFTERDEGILKKQGVEIFKMNDKGTMKLDTGKRFMFMNGRRCNEDYCNVFENLYF